VAARPGERLLGAYASGEFSRAITDLARATHRSRSQLIREALAREAVRLAAYRAPGS
jgi:predicted transcriptional regulator